MDIEFFSVVFGVVLIIVVLCTTVYYDNKNKYELISQCLLVSEQPLGCDAIVADF